MSSENAEMIAISALQFLAGHEEELGRFLSLSGLGVDDLRTQATESAFQSGLLSYLLGHEPSLLAFCENQGLDPQAVSKAQVLLAGPDGYEPST